MITLCEGGKIEGGAKTKNVITGLWTADATASESESESQTKPLVAKKKFSPAKKKKEEENC